MFDLLISALLPTLINAEGKTKGIKSLRDYPEIGDLVYSTDYVKHQSKLDGAFDVVVDKDELIGQIVQMNVADSKEDYVYHMKVLRPNNSTVYVAILNPYDESYYVMNNEYYRVVANPNYFYPNPNTVPNQTGDGSIPTQTGGTTTPKKPTPKPPEPTAPEDRTPIYPPIDESEPKPNYWLIGGIVGGGVFILIILIWAFSSSLDDTRAAKPKTIAAKK